MKVTIQYVRRGGLREWGEIPACDIPETMRRCHEEDVEADCILDGERIAFACPWLGGAWAYWIDHERLDALCGEGA